MKLTADRDSLLDALQVASRAVSTRSTLPSLSGVLLSASEGSVIARATDMELGLTVELDAEVDGPGTVLVPGRLFTDVVRALPEGRVTLEERSGRGDVELTAGTAQFHLRVLPTEDFPSLPEFEGEAIEVPATAVADTVERVARAASRDEVRPILTGILVSLEDSVLTMVATDSYRLSVKHTELGVESSESFEANVPARALRELARVIASLGLDRIEIALPGNQIVFRAGGVVITSRLIDGQFPSYRQLLPESFDHEVKLPRAELLDVTRRIRHLAQRNAPLRLEFSQGELTVSAETPEIGDASESMPCSFDGEELEIAFNPQFFIEGVESFDGEEVMLQLTSPLRPGLLVPATDDGFSYLVMPIRLNV